LDLFKLSTDKNRNGFKNNTAKSKLFLDVSSQIHISFGIWLSVL